MGVLAFRQGLFFWMEARTFLGTLKWVRTCLEVEKWEQGLFLEFEKWEKDSFFKKKRGGVDPFLGSKAPKKQPGYPADFSPSLRNMVFIIFEVYFLVVRWPCNLLYNSDAFVFQPLPVFTNLFTEPIIFFQNLALCCMNILTHTTPFPFT